MLKLVHSKKENPEVSLEEMSDDLISVNEAAALLHLKPKTVYNWMAFGRLKRIKIGRRTFCSKADLRGILAEAKGRDGDSI